MRTETGLDMTESTVDFGRLITAVLAHPFHGRLVERPIRYVRPDRTLKGERYKLTWWGEGVAYYEPYAA